MSGWLGGLTALILAGGVAPGMAQMAPAAAPEVLIATTFVTPLTYEAALQHLDAYYDEQVGRKGSVAFPEIGPHQHYEIWHDMWAMFDSPEDHARLTLKRPADVASARVVKSWMLDIAGRLNADVPLVFREEPGLKTVESEIYTSRRDLIALLAALPAMRPVASWRDSRLFVSATPLTQVALSAAGLHGEHQLRVTTVDLRAAKSLLSALQHGAARAGICGASSQEAVLDAEIHESAQVRNDIINNVAASPTLFHPQMDLKYIEERLRSDPAMQKRVAAAHGSYEVRYRIDRAYSKVTVTWAELTGYSAAAGSFDAARDLGQSSIPNVRQQPASAPMTVRVRLEPLHAGAYRVRLTGEEPAGEAIPIDDRIFWFDGKTFEEPQDPGR